MAASTTPGAGEAPRRRPQYQTAGPRARRRAGAPPGAPRTAAANSPQACPRRPSSRASLRSMNGSRFPVRARSRAAVSYCYSQLAPGLQRGLAQIGPPPIRLRLREDRGEVSTNTLTEFRRHMQKTRPLRNEISQKRTDCKPHCCQFASKRRCNSYAASSNVSATTAASLRICTDGAASISIPCCAARSARLQRAAPRAGRPRAAHHEPS